MVVIDLCRVGHHVGFRTFRQKTFRQNHGGGRFDEKNIPKRPRLKTIDETFRMICGAYPVYARSPSPSQRPDPTTIASRSPFPLSLCSCRPRLARWEYKQPKGPRGTRGIVDISEARFMPCIIPTVMVLTFFYKIAEFYKLVFHKLDLTSLKKTKNQNQDKTGRFGMKNLLKRFEFFC